MTYQLPASSAVDFNLDSAGYQPGAGAFALTSPTNSTGYFVPGAGAVDFNLSESPYIAGGGDFALGGDDSGGPPPIEYPIPPGIMVASGISITLTGSTPAGRGAIAYNGRPGRHAVRRSSAVIAAAMAFNGRTAQGWDKLRKLDDAGDTKPQSWDQAAPRWPSQSPQGWDKVAVKDDLAPAQAWDSSIRPIDQRAAQPWIHPPFKDVTDKQDHADSAKYWEMPHVEEVQEPTGYQPGGSDFDLTSAYTVPAADAAGFNLVLSDFIPPDPIVIPTRPVDSRSGAQGWDATTPADLRYRHPWDTKPRKDSGASWDYDQEPPLPDKPPAPDPEVKEAYLYMNASSLKKMPEGIPLEFADLSIALDIDSFSWSLSCTILNDESMSHIRPGPSGPVEVEVKVNNKTWRFMVERYSETARFPKRTYRISGSSLTQLLADPYSAKQSDQIDTPTNALQVAQGVLNLTGFSIDWDVSLADYTIPAGAWGYQDKTPIEVIDELVKASGGIVVPGLSNSTIYAKQRYREAPPWYWPSLPVSALDFHVADSMILSLSSEWQPTPEYRGVYVSGISAGVAVEVIKTGTDGTPWAADVYDALNLETDQCRGRGISILGQSGAQEIVTIELPIPTSGAPGLIIPGQFGEIQDTATPANSWRCLVLSNTVSVSKPGASRAVQTLKLERHHY